MHAPNLNAGDCLLREASRGRDVLVSLARSADARAGLVLVSGLLALFVASPAWADAALTTVRLASGFTQPLQVTHAPGDANRMFSVERTGRIKILTLSNNQVLSPAFLDVSTLIATNWLEYGLLGLTFHPQFQQNGFFYVNYTPPNGTIADTFVVRYRVSMTDPNSADTSTATPILRFGFGTRREHRAGWMDFGPDGYLYIATGDGAENDPDSAGQNTTLLRGKILRIDVNGPDGLPGTPDDDGFPADANRNYQIPATNPLANSPPNAPEIFEFGLRNPWRCSFDRLTGDLWIGDVGQGAREEIDLQPAGAAAGRNYGWRCTEGTFCTGLTGCTCNGPALTAPVFEYNHSVGLSVTGGYVYRGCVIPDLRGTYFYADYQVSKVFSFRYNGSVVTNQIERTSELAPGGGLTLQTPASFGEDLAGELYICDYSGGEIFKIVPRTAQPPSLSISQQPVPVSACVGATAQFQVTAASVGSPASYRWQADGTPLSDGGRINGSATDTLTITNVSAVVVASYNCQITNACMTLASAAAALTLTHSGDANCDGLANGFDVDPFVLALSDPVRYAQNFPGCPISNVDLNCDGLINNFDIDPFVALFNP